MKKSCIAMLLAGGQGSRLYALTQNVAKPSMPSEENTASLISPSPTARIPALTPWAC